MTQRFGKWPKYVGRGLDAWDTALVLEKRLYYVGNSFRIFKYFTNGLNMWELTQRFCKMPNILVKWLKYMMQGLSI